MCEKEKSHSEGMFSGMLLGGLVGVAIGILFAPLAGEKTREKLKEKLEEFDVDDIVRKFSHAFESGVDEAKKIAKEEGDE